MDIYPDGYIDVNIAIDKIETYIYIYILKEKEYKQGLSSVDLSESRSREDFKL